MYCLVLILLPSVSSLLLFGCNLADNLCDVGESCFVDGLFGQCYSADSGAPLPTVLSSLDDTQLELLRLEISRLATMGEQWTDERTQCTLAYFKLSMQYGLQYDADFCQVRSPANIWALVQLIDIGLNEDPSLLSQKVVVDDVKSELAKENEDDIQSIIEQISEPAPSAQDLQGVLNEAENGESGDPIVEEYLEDIVKQEKPDLSKLSDDQLDDLISRLFNMKESLEKEDHEEDDEVVPQKGEDEEVVPLDALDQLEQQNILKKDAEELGNVDLGLDNTAHKIVKGRKSAVTRIVGNRVYLKVNMKSEDQLQPLIEYLTNTIAIPNRLIFDDFHFENGQLSMRIARLAGEDKKEEGKTKRKDRIESVEGVAQAVYKRRKDIARYSGAEVAETGIGAGDETVAVESKDRDFILMPVLGICAFTVIALLAVLSVHVTKYARGYRRDNMLVAKANTEGKSCDAYEELCRQHHEANRSKSSSTSSWCGEEIANMPSIDISTGHVILNFLQENLSDPQKIESQWQQIENYNCDKTTLVAQENNSRNRTCLPFDDNLVAIDSWKEEKMYVNASFIYDDDPTQPMYVAAQTPSSDEIEAFWQLIWQHGIVLIVNLSTNDESRQEKTYWPDSGSHVHGPFEIHLVSEHIWSEDYLVRSFYLKNLRNGQTRTITQFHYISWQKDGTPTSAKSVLEFRRKVNKSYRGRSSSILVHSWDGIGRVGVYCAVDMLSARLVRGVRQLNVAATVEHLRDQRQGMVRTGDQFKLIYGCVAQEVTVLLKALQQQQH